MTAIRQPQPATTVVAGAADDSHYVIFDVLAFLSSIIFKSEYLWVYTEMRGRNVTSLAQSMPLRCLKIVWNSNKFESHM